MTSLEQGCGASEPKKKIPVTILTGFLGSGKTTLLRYILSSPDHGFRIAVIQNEYAEEMGIEAPTMVDGVSGEAFKDLWELPNGCICCSAKDDFVSAVDNLIEKRRGAFDYILVEATGVADPETIIQNFWLDDGLNSNIYLDGVVCLVDAGRVLRTLGIDSTEIFGLEDNNTGATASECGAQQTVEAASTNAQSIIEKDDSASSASIAPSGAGANAAKRAKLSMASAVAKGGKTPGKREAEKQLYSADVILCNKVDTLASSPGREIIAERAQKLVQFLRTCNADAEIYETVYANVPLTQILDLNAFDARRTANRLTEIEVCEVVGTVSKDFHMVSGGDLSRGRMLRIESRIVKFDEKTHFCPDLIERFFAEMLWDTAGADPDSDADAQAPKPEVLRAKGIFSDCGGQVHALQAVGETFEVVEVSSPPKKAEVSGGSASIFAPGETPVIVPKFLFIGHSLDAQTIRADMLSKCVPVVG